MEEKKSSLDYEQMNEKEAVSKVKHHRHCEETKQSSFLTLLTLPDCFVSSQ